MAYEDYIQELRKGPKTVEELSSNLHFSVSTVWSAMSELEELEVIVKERKGRNILYLLDPDYQRDIPYIKIGSGGKRYIRSLVALLHAYGKATRGIKALRAIPEIAAELLVIGWKAQQAYEKMDEKELKKLARRLKQLRLVVEEHYYQAINSYQILQQLKNTEDYWTTEGLRKFYNAQTNKLGIAIPPTDPTKALEIYQLMQQLQPD